MCKEKKFFEEVVDIVMNDIFNLERSTQETIEKNESLLEELKKQVQGIWCGDEYNNLEKFQTVSSLLERTHEELFGFKKYRYASSQYGFGQAFLYCYKGWLDKKEKLHKTILFYKIVLWLKENNFPVCYKIEDSEQEVYVYKGCENFNVEVSGRLANFKTLEEFIGGLEKELFEVNKHIAWLNSNY